MTETFKCGDIADIINCNNESEVKPKKPSKLSKKFKQIIEENQNKIIKIPKSQDLRSKQKSEDKTNNLKIEESDEEDIDGNEDVSDTEDLKTKRHSFEDSIEKKERTAFVGNLPKTITTKLLMKMFREMGPIESIRLRGAVPQKEKMSKKLAIITKSFHSGKDNIIAYVVFKSRDDVMKALKLNGTVVEGHHIRVDSVLHDSTHDNLRSVFVGNLPFVVKEDQLYDFFQDCGDIESVRVVRDTATGVGKGFGFILFKTKDSVILALEKHEKTFLGRDLRVTRAKGNPKVNRNKPENRFKEKKNISAEKESVVKKDNKKFKKSHPKPEFEGISAKKIKKKSNKKKEFLSINNKKKQKKLAQIFSH